MASSIGNVQYNPRHRPLSLEAERLAIELEQTLIDPSATEAGYFHALDRFASVLTTLTQQRQDSKPNTSAS